MAILDEEPKMCGIQEEIVPVSRCSVVVGSAEELEMSGDWGSAETEIEEDDRVKQVAEW